MTGNKIFMIGIPTDAVWELVKHLSKAVVVFASGDGASRQQRKKER